MIAYAYCFKSGDIGIVNNDADIPHVTLVFAIGDDAEIRDQVEAKARIAYDNTTWLVPGVPEAPDGKEFKAFERWHTWAFPHQGCPINLLEGSF